MRPHLLFLTLALGWLLCTYWVAGAERYRAVGAELLRDPQDPTASSWMIRPGKAGEVSALAAGARVRVLDCPTNIRCIAAVAQEVPAPAVASRVALRLQARAEGVLTRPGEAGVGLYLSSKRSGEPHWHIALRPLELPLDGAWHDVEQVFDVSASGAPWTVHLSLAARQGTLELRSPSLRVVKDRFGLVGLRIGLGALGIAGLMVLLSPALRRARRSPSNAAAVVLFGAILLGTLSPREWSWPVWDAAVAVESVVSSAEPAPVPVGVPVEAAPKSSPLATGASAITRAVDKLAHLFGFAALAISLGVGWGRTEWPRAALLVLSLAVATEALQLFTEDRGARWTDVGIDLLGAAIGAGVWALARRR